MSDSFTPLQDSFTPLPPKSSGDSFVPLDTTPRDSFTPQSSPQEIQSHIAQRDAVGSQQDMVVGDMHSGLAQMFQSQKAQEKVPLDDTSKAIVDHTRVVPPTEHSFQVLGRMSPQDVSKIFGDRPNASVDAKRMLYQSDIEHPLTQEDVINAGKNRTPHQNLVYNWELAKEGLEKAPEMLIKTARMIESSNPLLPQLYIQKALEARGMIKGQDPEADDYLKHFQDYVDKSTTFDPEHVNQRTFTNNMFQFMGSLPTLYFGGQLLGAGGTAADLARGHALFTGLMAGANSQDIADSAKNLALSKGDSYENASLKGQVSGALALPFEYTTAYFNPLSKLHEDSLGSGFMSRVIGGAVTNTLTQGLMNEEHSIFTPLLSDPLHRDAAAMQLYGYSLKPNEDSVKLMLGQGALMGGISPGRRLEIDQALAQINIKSDAIGYDELRRVLSDPPEKGGLGLETKGTLLSLDVFHKAAQETARRENIPVEEVYARSIATAKERSLYTASVNGKEVLSQEANKTADFYSTLVNTIHGEAFSKAFGDKPVDTSQVWSWLKTQPGVKGDELEWTGLRSLFEHAADVKSKGGEAKISRGELQDYIDKNQVRLDTVTKKDQSALSDIRDQRNDLYVKMHELETKIDGEENPEKLAPLQQEYQSVREALEKNKGDLYATQYDSITAPGPKSNYEEWLLRVPQPIEKASDEEFSKMSYDQKAQVGQEKVKFQSSHWDEPNVIMHIRVDTRMSDKGPMMFVNEVQSDWHQEGRTSGYLTPEHQQKEQDLRAKVNDLNEQRLSLTRKIAQVEKEEGPRYANEPSQATKLKSDLRKIENQLKLESSNLDKLQEVSTPEGPFSKTWPNLALKKLLLEAVNRGVNRIGWASGELQDVFQGVVNEEQSQGRKKFYDEILPQILRDVLKKEWGIRKELEISKIPTQMSSMEWQPDSDASSKGFYRDKHESPILSLSITPEMREKIFEKGASLFQGERASVGFLNNGRAIIQGLDQPDFSSAMHEFAHVFRRSFMSEEDLQGVERELKVQDGFWTREHEEKYAKMFERYITKGISPSGEFNQMFRDARAMMLEVYKTAEKAGTQFNDRVGATFDHLFIQDSDPVKAARNELAIAKSKVDSYMNEGKDLPEQQLLVEQAKAEQAQAERKLFEAQQNNFNPRVPTNAEKLWEKFHDVFPSLVTRPEDQTTWRKLRSAIGSFVNGYTDASKNIANNDVGKKVIELGKNFAFENMRMKGDLEYARNSFEQMITPEDRENMRKIGENGWSRARDLLEGDSKPATPGEQAFVKMANVVNDYITRGQMENGVMRRMLSGEWIPSVRSPDLKAPHKLTPYGYELLEGKKGAEAWKYVEEVQRVNGDPTITYDQVMHELRLRNDVPLGSKGKQGSVEGSRGDIVFPDAYMLNGKQIDVFHNDPVDMMNSWISKDVQRLARIKTFGQDALENYADKSKPQFYSQQFNLAKLFDKIPEGINANGDYSKDVLYRRLENDGVDRSELRGKSLKDLREIADQRGVETVMPLHEVENIVKNLVASDLSGEDQAELRKLAEKVGGINSRQDIQNVLEGLRHRYTTNVLDNLEEVIKQNYRTAGGDTSEMNKYFERVNSIFGGRPEYVHKWWFHALQGASNGVSALMTGISWIRHIGQPALQIKNVPFDLMGEVVKNEFKAIVDRGSLEADPETMRYLAQARASYMSNTTFGVKETGKALRNFADNVFFKRYLRETNELASVQTGRAIADKWTTEGLPVHEKGLARSFGLTWEDLDDLQKVKSGEISLGSERQRDLYERTVRGFLAKTLGGSFEMPQNRSLIETNPIARYFMGWQSFLSLRARNMLDTVEEFRSSMDEGGNIIKNKQFWGASARLVAMMASTVGVGMMQEMLRNAVHQTPKYKDESWWDHIRGSIFETGLFGQPLAVFENMSYANYRPERALMGMFPQVAGMVNLLSAIMGKGRYGNFPAPKRIGQAIEDESPPIKAIDRYISNETYPQIKDYNEVRAMYRGFIEGKGQMQDFSDTPIRPDLYAVFQDVQRGDQQQAVKDQAVFIRNEVAKGINPKDAIARLRLSLESRRPVPLAQGKKDFGEFFSKLTPAQRQQMLQTEGRYEGMVDVLTKPH